MNTRQVQIIVAIIGIVGVLGAALISNWDKLFTSAKQPIATEKSLSQSSAGNHSPNIANVKGNVNINISSDKSQSDKLDIPNFEGKINSSREYELFYQFMDKNCGKIVHINMKTDGSFSKLADKNSFALSPDPCPNPDKFFTECVATYLHFEGNHNLEWYKGDIRFSGYFVIDENISMGQGEHYGLKSIPAEQMLLQTQRSVR